MIPVTMAERRELSSVQKIKWYRDLAADARKEAALANGTLNRSYLLMAEQWERLAAEVEGFSNRQDRKATELPDPVTQEKTVRNATQPEEQSGPAGERRQARRNRVLLGGIVISRDGAQTWDCSVKSLSDVGAKIQLSQGQIIPEHAFFVELNNGVGYEVTIIWLKPPHVGLKFLSSHHLETLNDPKLQFMRRLWQERRRR